MLARSIGPVVLVALLLALSLGLTSPSPSLAQDGPPTTATIEPDPPPGYRETVNEAVAEFAEGHHAEARALFRQAHAAYPNARTLRGIGMCAFELREYADAVRHLQASLGDPRRALTPEQTAQVQDALRRAEAFVGRYEVVVPEGASLFVDDSAAPVPLEADGTLLLALGTHVVTTRRGSTRLGDVRVEVRGGEREPLRLITPEVARVESGLAALPPPTPSTTTTRTAAADPVPAIVLLVSGGALLITGASLVGAGVADASTVTNAPAGTPWSSLRDAYDRAPLLSGIGAASLGVGAALGVVGAVWLATASGSSTETPPAAQSRVTLDVFLGGVGVRGMW